jgi:hypothetical protein
MRCALCLSVVVLLCAAAADAQLLTGAGSVHGIVRDPYYEGLPGADVVLTNKALRIARLREPSLDGMFLAPSLPPGPATSSPSNAKASSVGIPRSSKSAWAKPWFSR